MNQPEQVPTVSAIICARGRILKVWKCLQETEATTNGVRIAHARAAEDAISKASYHLALALGASR
jgi:hypothetical protein